MITVDVRDAVAPDAVDAVYRWFHRVDELFSTWRDDSEVSRLAHGTLDRRDVSDEVNEVLDLCDWLRAETWGGYDANVGADPRVTPREGLGRIDPSGAVKGWALDRAAAMLRTAGATDFSINAGGDVVVSGCAEPGEPWRVGIQHPSARDKVAAVVLLTAGGVATSGRYERGDHVLDPRTGGPATDLVAVSVIADRLAVADGYATGLLALGVDAQRWLCSRPDVAALTIDNEGIVTTTEEFDRLTPPPP